VAHIEHKLMAPLLDMAHFHAHRRLPTIQRCQQAKELVMEYRIFEWWIRSCCLPATEKERRTILRYQVPYSREIAKNIWDWSGKEYCKKLKWVLNLRKTFLIEFAQNLILAPMDLYLVDADT